jgi:hypothetical protein
MTEGERVSSANGRAFQRRELPETHPTPGNWLPRDLDPVVPRGPPPQGVLPHRERPNLPGCDSSGVEARWRSQRHCKWETRWGMGGVGEIHTVPIELDPCLRTPPRELRPCLRTPPRELCRLAEGGRGARPARGEQSPRGRTPPPPSACRPQQPSSAAEKRGQSRSTRAPPLTLLGGGARKGATERWSPKSRLPGSQRDAAPRVWGAPRRAGLEEAGSCGWRRRSRCCLISAEEGGGG